MIMTENNNNNLKFQTQTLGTNMSSKSTALSAQPVIHRPCSATMGKFHDSVNYSLCVGGSNANKTNLNTSKSSSKHLEAQEQMDSKAKAREKYKYMIRTKTYVDESLFASSNPVQQKRGETPIEFYSSPSSHHLSHSQMSQITPLIHNAPVVSARIGSARGVDMAQVNELINNNNNPNSQDNRNLASASKTRSKPWKP